MKFCILASGSAGNSAFLSNGETRILIDAGLNAKQLRLRLYEIGEDLGKIDAVVVTHGHGDHTAALPMLARGGMRAVIYMTMGTASEVKWNGGARPDRIETFAAGSRFSVDGIDIQSFPIPHDAAEPVGFRITVDGVKVVVCTDLGYLPEPVREQLKPANVLLLEANYDAGILRVGPYPWSVRQRLLSRVGHLDNAETMDFISKELGSETAYLTCGHISSHNNHAAIVEMLAREALERRGLSPRLSIASQDRVGEVVLL